MPSRNSKPDKAYYINMLHGIKVGFLLRCGLVVKLHITINLIISIILPSFYMFLLFMYYISVQKILREIFLGGWRYLQTHFRIRSLEDQNPYFLIKRILFGKMILWNHREFPSRVLQNTVASVAKGNWQLKNKEEKISFKKKTGSTNYSRPANLKHENT